ncbi:MAG: methyltransferase [Microthrixaceae bacterium]|nr:methyltransferase [Microthrixaceae bacterium]
MTDDPTDTAGEDEDVDFLVVDEYLSGAIEMLALKAALDSGLIDQLLVGRPPTGQGLEGYALHIEILRIAGVLVEADGVPSLTTRFRSAMAYRDLLEVKLRFATMFLRDVFNDPISLFDVAAQRSTDYEYLRHFRYDLASSRDPAERQYLADWVRYMTTLTRYEAGAVLRHCELSSHRRVLDIGGNSGELAHSMCDRCADLHVTVFDLPAVVALGTEWNRGRDNADRVTYVGGDAFKDRMPTGFDLVVLKGVLHDWREPEAAQLISAAWNCLDPGGTLLVAERSRPHLGDHAPIAAGTFNLSAWFWAFRTPDDYLVQLRALGAIIDQADIINLDLPWMIVRARKP